METSGKKILQNVTLTLLKPANTLLSLVDATKYALLETYQMTEEEANKFINTALDTIRKANEAEKMTRQMCEEQGVNYEDFMKDMRANMKAQGIDVDAEYKAYEEAWNEIEKHL